MLGIGLPGLAIRGKKTPLASTPCRPNPSVRRFFASLEMLGNGFFAKKEAEIFIFYRKVQENQVSIEENENNRR